MPCWKVLQFIHNLLTLNLNKTRKAHVRYLSIVVPLHTHHTRTYTQMLMNICHTLLDIVSFSIHLLSVHRPLLGPTVLPTHHVWVSGQILQLFIQNVELFNPQAESPCWLGLSIYFIDFTLHCAALTMHPNSVVISCIFTCKKRWSSVSSVKKYFQDDLWIKLFAQYFISRETVNFK